MCNKRELTQLQKPKTMIKAFKVYKEGRTTRWITIVIPEAEFNDVTLKFKLDKFTYLGYQIEMI